MIRATRSARFAALLALFVAACKSGPDYRAPDLAPPPSYAGAKDASSSTPPPTSSSSSSSSSLEPTWWTMFSDAKLAELESAALAHNPDLSAAASRVVEARAAAKSVASGSFPTVTFDPSATRQRSAQNGRASTTSVVRAPVDVSYELDVWGRVRRANEAALASEHASAAEYGVVLETLTADLAQNYFSLRGLDAEEAILLRSIALFQRESELTGTQFRAGLVGQTDVLQAKTQLELANAQVIDVRRQRADLEHAIAILTGRAPSEVSLAASALVGEPPPVPVGLPAELLRRRPDVASAENQLIAANADIGVADANFYPSLRLTGAVGFESSDVDGLLDWVNRFWSIGASATAPIFEGGALDAAREAALARYDELKASYRSALLASIREVEDSLSDLHLRADAAAAQGRAVDAAREYLRLAEIQYRQGLVGYLVVIDAERTLLNTELSASQIATQRFVASVALVKALGGGWTNEASEAAADAHPATGPSESKAPAANGANTKP